MKVDLSIHLYFGLGLAGVLAQPVQIDRIIFIGEKASLAIVATLDNISKG